MINERAKAILDFCFIKTSSDQWFKKDKNFDNKLRELFALDYQKAINNEYNDWQDKPEECVALVLLLDQLSRNFFRNSFKAYDQDYKCRLIVNEAVDRGYLEELDMEKIHFLLLPLIHSEDLSDHIQYDYLYDNQFAELKESELLEGRLGILATIEPYIGKYYSTEYVRKKVLRQTDSEIIDIDEQIEDEIQKGILPDPSQVDPITGEPLPQDGINGEAGQVPTNGEAPMVDPQDGEGAVLDEPNGITSPKGGKI